MKDKIYILSIIFFICTIVLISANFEFNDSRLLLSKRIDFLMPENSFDFQYLSRRDTIFIKSDSYISISLKEQITRLYRMNDSTLTFHISSGTDLLDKGMKTTTGIFTVQSKLRLGISKQFNNAELINWIGFNGNIGFHGLSTSGYYNHLGKRPSSHGCVRISREDGDSLYKYVKLGTPVIVYDDEPARILSFLNHTDKYFNYIDIYDNTNLNKLLKNRINNLYSGLANKDFYDKLILDNNIILKKLKIPIGDATKIASKQKFIGLTKNFEIANSDKTNFYSFPNTSVSDDDNSIE